MDLGPEWRSFDHEQRDKRSRVGAPMTNTIHDKGLSTVIGWKNQDSHGKNLSSKDKAQWYRLRKWQKRIRISNGSERSLALALTELDRYSSRLGVPRSVREDASLLYRRAANKSLIHGRSSELIVGAAIYISCRRFYIPRTLDEISMVADISKKQLGRVYRLLARELNIKLPITYPAEYIPRFASKLGLSNEVQSKAIEIIDAANEQNLIYGKSPLGTAAAALYIASVLLNDRRSQHHIALVAGVTEVTVRNRYKELAHLAGEDFSVQ